MRIPGIENWSKGAYVYNIYINGKLETGKLQL
jgi:hypothetical protein